MFELLTLPISNPFLTISRQRHVGFLLMSDPFSCRILSLVGSFLMSEFLLMSDFYSCQILLGLSSCWILALVGFFLLMSDLFSCWIFANVGFCFLFIFAHVRSFLMLDYFFAHVGSLLILDLCCNSKYFTYKYVECFVIK